MSVESNTAKYLVPYKSSHVVAMSSWTVPLSMNIPPMIHLAHQIVLVALQESVHASPLWKAY